MAGKVRIISKARLRLFWQSPGRTDAQTPLLTWYKVVGNRSLSWRNFTELRATYARASIFEDCVVFNIGGNKYRLIARIRYPTLVYVVQVLTHEDYDKGFWKDECRCADRHKAKTKQKRSTRRTVI